MISIEMKPFACANEDIIGHFVGTNGSWMYNHIVKQFPVSYEKYKEMCKLSDADYVLGRCVFDYEGGRWVAELFVLELGKEHCFEGAISCEYLEQALEGMKKFARVNGLSIALPYVRNNDLFRIIARVFNDYPISLYET